MLGLRVVEPGHRWPGVVLADTDGAYVCCEDTVEASVSSRRDEAGFWTCLPDTHRAFVF